MRFTTVLAITTLCGAIFAPRVRAEFDKKTFVTFHESIEIPGMVLPAGDYVIKRVDRPLPEIVRFTNAAENHIYATVVAMPTYRPVPSDNVVIITEERAGNAPEAIKKWFYPGDTVGAEFVYPKSYPTKSGSSPVAMNLRPPRTSEPIFSRGASPAPVAATDNARSQPASVRSTEEVVPQSTLPPATAPGSAGSPARTPQSALLGPPKPRTQEETARAASNVLWFSLLGLICVCGGWALRKFSRGIHPAR